jgi:hypothetical protein
MDRRIQSARLQLGSHLSAALTAALMQHRWQAAAHCLHAYVELGDAAAGEATLRSALGAPLAADAVKEAKQRLATDPGAKTQEVSLVARAALAGLQQRAGPLLAVLMAPASGLGAFDLLGAVLLQEITAALAEGLPGEPALLAAARSAARAAPLTPHPGRLLGWQLLPPPPSQPRTHTPARPSPRPHPTHPPPPPPRRLLPRQPRVLPRQLPRRPGAPRLARGPCADARRRRALPRLGRRGGVREALEPARVFFAAVSGRRRRVRGRGPRAGARARAARRRAAFAAAASGQRRAVGGRGARGVGPRVPRAAGRQVPAARVPARRALRVVGAHRRGRAAQPAARAAAAAAAAARGARLAARRRRAASAGAGAGAAALRPRGVGTVGVRGGSARRRRRRRRGGGAGAGDAAGAPGRAAARAPA